MINQVQGRTEKYLMEEAMDQKIKVFIEYKIRNEKMTDYKKLILQIQEIYSEKQYFAYEGVDQPGLIVEEFFVSNMEEYSQIKNNRLNGSTPIWHELADCIEGGAQKMHIWAFAQL